MARKYGGSGPWIASESESRGAEPSLWNDIDSRGIESLQLGLESWWLRRRHHPETSNIIASLFIQFSLQVCKGYCPNNTWGHGAQTSPRSYTK